MSKLPLSPLDDVDENALTSLELRRNWQALTAARLPRWVSHRLTYEQLASGATTTDAIAFGVPSGTVVLGAKLKHATAFAGTGTYSVSLGVTGSPTLYIASFNVMQAVSGTAFALSAALMNGLNHDQPTDIVVRAVADVATNLATAGVLDVWLYIATVA